MPVSKWEAADQGEEGSYSTEGPLDRRMESLESMAEVTPGETVNLLN